MTPQPHKNHTLNNIAIIWIYYYSFQHLILSSIFTSTLCSLLIFPFHSCLGQYIWWVTIYTVVYFFIMLPNSSSWLDMSLCTVIIFISISLKTCLFIVFLASFSRTTRHWPFVFNCEKIVHYWLSYRSIDIT